MIWREQLRSRAYAVHGNLRPPSHAYMQAIHHYPPFAYVYIIPVDYTIHTNIPPFRRAAIRTHVDTRATECPYMCARTDARTHRQCRRAQRPRHIEPRPSVSAAVARRRPRAAHTMHNVVTRAVFHAPMSTLNADADVNACEPSRTRSAPTERARSFGADTGTQIRRVRAKYG